MKIKNFRDKNFKFKNYRVIDHLTIENYDKIDENDKNYWKLIPGKNGHKWDEFYSNDFIAIGWDLINYDQGNIIEQVKENYPNETPNYVKKRYDYFNKEMKIGDLVLLYSNKTILNIALIKSDWYLDHDADEFKNRRKVDWLLSEPVDAEKFNSNFYNKIKQQYTITEIDEKEYIEIIENKILNSKSKKNQILSFDIDLNIQKLHFPQAMKDNLTKRIETNLSQGKHIILTGPPGTGKSKLAKEIAERYVGQNYEMVTATSDWSTFDTIGGYRPDKNSKLEFSSGIFLDCFKNNHAQQSKWLLIDEINRADIDKAFGPLFSALTGDSITLSFKDNDDNYIKVVPEKEIDKIEITDNIYQINNDWRIIATMNTFDKTSLYEMSYAFMRRFAFIPVSIPKKIDHDLINNYLECWEIAEEDNYTSEVIELWRQINNVRKIGPAIIEDIYKYLLENKDDYISDLISYVIPQFEGVRSKELNSFKSNIKELDFINDQDFELLENFIEDYFQLGGI